MSLNESFSHWQSFQRSTWTADILEGPASFLEFENLTLVTDLELQQLAIEAHERIVASHRRPDADECCGRLFAGRFYIDLPVRPLRAGRG